MNNKDNNNSIDLHRVGIYPNSPKRSGTFICRNDKTTHTQTSSKSIELLPIAEALKKYPLIKKKYFWKHVHQDDNMVTKLCAKTNTGFFLRVKKDSVINNPCQVALCLTNSANTQFVHNVIVVEENAQIELITGCLAEERKVVGKHMAITEIFVEKNAVLNNVVIHSWNKLVEVYPHTVTHIETSGQITTNYISLQAPSKTISNPVTILKGANSNAKLQNVLLGSPGSSITVGGDVYLIGKNTGAELIHRAVSTGGKIVQKGFLIGKNICKAHIDCAGMVLPGNSKDYITSMPGLKSYCSDAQMSHEASLGKIIPEQVEYLMAHGMDEKEAISIIIRGFLDINIKGLSDELNNRIAEVVEIAGHSG